MPSEVQHDYTWLQAAVISDISGNCAHSFLVLILQAELLLCVAVLRPVRFRTIGLDHRATGQTGGFTGSMVPV